MDQCVDQCCSIVGCLRPPGHDGHCITENELMRGDNEVCRPFNDGLPGAESGVHGESRELSVKPVLPRSTNDLSATMPSAIPVSEALPVVAPAMSKAISFSSQRPLIRRSLSNNRFIFVRTDPLEHDDEACHKACCSKYKLLIGICIACIVGVGVAKVAAMIFAMPERSPRLDLDETKLQPAPDMNLFLTLMVLCMTTSIVFGIMLTNRKVVLALRGSLELTTVKISDLQSGRKYKFKIRTKQSEDETPDDLLLRRLEQLRREAELAGWTSKMLADQEMKAIQTHEAVEYCKRAAARSDTSSQPGIMFKLRNVLHEVFFMTKHTIFAMPRLIIFLVVLEGVVLFVAGFVGTLLTLHIMHMPKSEDALYIEYSWQVVNIVFTVNALYKCPQRAILLYHLLARRYTELVGVKLRSMLIPGVLLCWKRVLWIALLRNGYVLCQSIICFFMWAYWPRCIQEIRSIHSECLSRPVWAVPLFLVVGVSMDVFSGVILFIYTSNCRYVMWPTDSPAEDAMILEFDDGAADRKLSCNLLQMFETEQEEVTMSDSVQEVTAEKHPPVLTKRLNVLHLLMEHIANWEAACVQFLTSLLAVHLPSRYSTSTGGGQKKDNCGHCSTGSPCECADK